MSHGDQVVTQLIGGVGTWFSALIGAFFGEFVTPFFNLVASWFGL